MFFSSEYSLAAVKIEAGKRLKEALGVGLVAGAFALSSPAILADDAMAALGAGGIELLHSEHVAMEEQDLFLSSREVRTRFLFRNESVADIETLVAFVMPDIFPEDLFKREDVPLLRQLDFRLTVNGRRLRPKADIRAILDGKDVTDRLRTLGIVLDGERGFLSLIPADLDPARRVSLRAEGLLHTLHPDTPGWTTRLRLYWQQRFPAGAQVEIEHAYSPFLGAENLTPESLDVPSVAEAVCLSGVPRRRARALLQRPGSQARTLDYVLSTGSHWKGPIRALAVTIEKQNEADVVSTCLPGLKPQGRLAYGVLLKNAKPTQDIHVLFIERGPMVPASQ